MYWSLSLGCDEKRPGLPAFFVFSGRAVIYSLCEALPHWLWSAPVSIERSSGICDLIAEPTREGRAPRPETDGQRPGIFFVRPEPEVFLPPYGRHQTGGNAHGRACRQCSDKVVAPNLNMLATPCPGRLAACSTTASVGPISRTRWASSAAYTIPPATGMSCTTTAPGRAGLHVRPCRGMDGRDAAILDSDGRALTSARCYTATFTYWAVQIMNCRNGSCVAGRALGIVEAEPFIGHRLFLTSRDAPSGTSAASETWPAAGSVDTILS